MNLISEAIGVFKSGKTDEAINILESMIKDDNIEFQIQGKITLADIYLNLGRVDQSITIAEEATILVDDDQTLDKKRKIHFQLHSRLVLIVAMGRKGKTIESIKLIDKTIEEFNDKLNHQDSDILSNYADIIGIKGTLLSRKGKYDNAIELMEQSLEFHLKADNTQRISAMKYNIGTTYSLKKDFEKAIEYLTSAAQIQEKSGNIMGTGYVNMEMGGIYLKTGDLEKAKECFEKNLVY